MATVDEIRQLNASNEATRQSDLQNFVNSNNQQVQGLIDSQNSRQDSLFGQYKDAVAGQEKLPDLYSRLSNEAGIPDLSNQLKIYKDQIYRTKDLLDKLDGDITSRTQGTLTTEAMRDRMVASEGNTLNTQLSRLGTGMAPISDQLTSAQNQLSTLLPLYEQQQEKELSPLTMQINSLSDRFAREITGFTTQRENTLASVMDAITRGRQVDDATLQQAEQIAAQERQFQQQRALAAQAASASYLGGGGGYSAPQQASSGITPQQVNDYSFVNGLIKQVNAGNGSSTALIIAQAKAGDPRSKAIMQQFYALQNKPIPAGFKSFLS
jgi:hypothetical protein